MNQVTTSNQQSELYAVVGNPIHHSQSPLIHTLFAKQTHISLRYEKRCTTVDRFPQMIHDFIKERGKGLNITLPFKRNAYSLAHHLTPRARLAGAVNTLKISDNHILGDNTDGIGLITDLTKNLNYDLSQKKILLLGAGGAARGVLAPLIECQPAVIFIANRTADHARALAMEFSDLSTNTTYLAGGGIDEIPKGEYNLLINASASSLENNLPPLPSQYYTFDLVYDMMYGPHPTVLLQWAQARNIKTADGLGMLIEQAAHAFLLWHGILPHTASVLETVRQAIT